jgi:hypothetical protein
LAERVAVGHEVTERERPEVFLRALERRFVVRGRVPATAGARCVSTAGARCEPTAGTRCESTAGTRCEATAGTRCEADVVEAPHLGQRWRQHGPPAVDWLHRVGDQLEPAQLECDDTIEEVVSHMSEIRPVSV